MPIINRKLMYLCELHNNILIYEAIGDKCNATTIIDEEDDAIYYKLSNNIATYKDFLFHQINIFVKAKLSDYF